MKQKSRVGQNVVLRPSRPSAVPSSKSAGQSTPVVSSPSAKTLDLWRKADAVCFDVDSTFCEDESIDEIAAFLGVGEEVAALTARAMGGSMKFQEALALRLNTMQVSRQKLDQYLEDNPARLTEGIPDLVRALQGAGKGVFLVSGGFRQVIHPIADSLGIPRDHVFANNLLFKEDGQYQGFDESEFTSRSGGKATAIREIKARHGYGTIVMVGDGATDLEARQQGGADLFIGYGGAVYRPNIAELADWYLFEIQPLIDALRT